MSDVRSTEPRLADLDLLTDEERARRQANWRRNFPGAGDRPLTLAEIVAKPDEEWVKCTIPTGFTIRAQNGVQVPFPVGEYDVPKSLAEHWYFRANGGIIGDAPKREDKPEYEPPASGLSTQPWDAGQERRSRDEHADPRRTAAERERNLPYSAPRADDQYTDRPDHRGPYTDQHQDERHPAAPPQHGRDAHADARRPAEHRASEEHPEHPETPPPGTPTHPQTPPPGAPSHPDVPKPPEQPSHPDVPGAQPHPEPQRAAGADAARRDQHQDERQHPSTAPRQPVQPAAPVPPPMSAGQPTLAAQPVQQPQAPPAGQARQAAQPSPGPRTGPPEPRQTDEKKP